MNADNTTASGAAFPSWDYMFTGGTSFSAPFVSGAAAVVRQYLQDQDGITDPHGTLIKAVLINGARDLGYGFMSCNNSPTHASCNVNHLQNGRNVQGWGEVDLKNSLFPDPPRSWGYQNVSGASAGVQTGSQNDITVNVADSSVPLKVNLVWADIAGSSGCTSCLVNNLRLIVIAPGGGTTYYGNNFSGSWSTTGTYNDDRNVVESVYIQNPTTGNWTFRVYGTNVPTMLSGFTRYPYSLVYSGGFGPYGPAVLAPNRSKFPAIVERSVPAEPRVLRVGTSMTYGLRIYNYGSTNDTITLSRNQTVPAAGSPDFTVTFNPAGPSYAIASGAYLDVDVTITAGGTMTNAQLKRYEMHFRVTSATTSIADTVVLGFSLQNNPTYVVANGYYSQRYPDAAVGADGTLYAVFQSAEKLPDQAAPSTYTGSNTHWDDGYNILYHEHSGGDPLTTQHVTSVIMFTYSTNNGVTWSTPEQISSTSTNINAERPSVAVTTNNDVVVVWNDPYYETISARVRAGGAGGSWGSIATLITTTGYCAGSGTDYLYTPYGAKVVADGSGNAIALYLYAPASSSWNNIFSAQVWNGSSWGSRIGISSPAGNLFEYPLNIHATFDAVNNRVWAAFGYYPDIDSATAAVLGAVYGVAPYSANAWRGASGGSGGTINPQVTGTAITNKHLMGIGCGAGRCFIGYASGETKQTNESWYLARVSYQTASGSPESWSSSSATFGSRIAWFNYSDIYPEPVLAYDANGALMHMVLPNRMDPQIDYQATDFTSTLANNYAAAGTTQTTITGGAVWAQPEKILFPAATPGCGKLFTLQDFYRDEAGPTRNGGLYVTDIGTCGVPCAMTVNVTPDGTTTVCTGTNIQFTATPSNGTPPYTYQWTENGANIGGATSSTYTANKGTAGSYTYNCKVTDSSGSCTNITDPSDSTGTWNAAPAAPGAPVLTPGCTNVNLSWTAVSGATDYEVWRATGNGTCTSAVQAASTTGGATTYNDTGRTTGTQYSYYIKAKNTCGTSGNGTCAATTTLSTPAAPGAPVLTPGCTSVNLSWSAVSGATDYEVWRNQGANCTGAVQVVATTGGATTYNNTGLSGNTQYSYYIKAKNACGTSGNGTCATTTTVCVPNVQYDNTFNPLTTLAEVCGDGDGYVEPGEQWTVRVRLVNTGDIAATAVQADLAISAGSEVIAVISGNSGQYGDIAAAGTALTALPYYQFEVPAGVVCPKNLIFDVINIRSTGYTYAAAQPAFTVVVGANLAQSGTADPAAASSSTTTAAYSTVFSAPTPVVSANVSYAFTYAGSGGTTDLFGPDDFNASIAAWTASTGVAWNAGSAHCAPHSNGLARFTRSGGTTSGYLTQTTAIDTTGYTDLRVIFDYTHSNAGNVVRVDYSNNGGGAWTNGANLTGDTAWNCNQTVNLGGLAGSANFKIRFYFAGAANASTTDVDYVSIIGGSGGGSSWQDHVLTELVAPNGTSATTLKGLGTSETSPADTHDVTAFYNTHGGGTYTLRITESGGGTADITTSTLSVNYTECTYTNCGAVTPPPPVQHADDGAKAAARFTKGAGNTLNVDFDAATCSAEKAVILYGALNDFTGYDGCAQNSGGNTGSTTIDSTAHTSVWYNIVWTNSTVAGHPGFNSGGARTWAAAGYCGMAADDPSDGVCD